MAAGILVAAELREQRAKAVHRGALVLYGGNVWYGDVADQLSRFDASAGDEQHWPYADDEPMHPFLGDPTSPEIAEHIAAEANPEHALAAVRHWRGVVGRHRLMEGQFPPACTWCWTDNAIAQVLYPCPDLAEIADEARAYLGGAR